MGARSDLSADCPDRSAGPQADLELNFPSQFFIMNLPVLYIHKINEINKIQMKWVGRPKISAAARTKGGIAHPGTGTHPPTMREARRVLAAGEEQDRGAEKPPWLEDNDAIDAAGQTVLVGGLDLGARGGGGCRFGRNHRRLGCHRRLRRYCIVVRAVSCPQLI